jgi:hypothetical protein
MPFLGGALDIQVTAHADQPVEELRSLWEWLGDVDVLRGRVRPLESPPVPGTLGPVLDALSVALGPAGAVTGLTTALLSWIRYRTTDVSLRLNRPGGGSIEISAKRVRALDASALHAEVEQLSRALDGGVQARDVP